MLYYNNSKTNWYTYCTEPFIAGSYVKNANSSPKTPDLTNFARNPRYNLSPRNFVITRNPDAKKSVVSAIDSVFSVTGRDGEEGTL